MTSAITDSRAVVEYRVPASSLRPGDLVNTAPLADQDWQKVTAVYTQDTPIADNPDVDALITTFGDRYVLVELTDIAPVDNEVYFTDGAAYIFGAEHDSDIPVEEALGDGTASRSYLYTVHELVTIRG
jgi:hypothetical protein